MFVIGIQCGAGELYVLIWSRAVSLLDLPSVLLADWLSFGLCRHWSVTRSATGMRQIANVRLLAIPLRIAPLANEIDNVAPVLSV